MSWIFVRMFLMNKPNYKDCTKDEERCIWMLRNIHKLKEYPVWVEESKYKGFVKSSEIANFDAEKHKRYSKAMLSDGLSVDKVRLYTGLTTEQICNLL